MSANKDSWSDETMARAVQLWAEGHSASEIGRRIGRTKNSVLGMARRRGWAGRASVIPSMEARTDLAPFDADIRRMAALGWGGKRIGKAIKATDGKVRNYMRRHQIVRADIKVATEIRPIWRSNGSQTAQRTSPKFPKMPEVTVTGRTDGVGCQYPLWPHGERPPQPQLYCGEPVVMRPGFNGAVRTSWCACHYALVFQMRAPMLAVAA